MNPCEHNRLKGESALYLQQHANQPVHWQPWDETAFAAAKARDCPVFVSIGYSSCHWCHVMARECFDNADIAQCLNQHCVSIKVDKELRPDLDRFFQMAHQLMRGQPGGWPLSAFVDPDTRLPFFIATYLPPTARHGLPAFTDVVQELSRLYRDDRANIQKHGRALQEALSQRPQPQNHEKAQPDSWLSNWLSAQDAKFGGTSGAPKFPLFGAWLATIDLVHSAEPPKPLALALDAMSTGGLRDHLAGGFFRYCVDQAWHLPHFEKMLYDNAMALLVYARAASRWHRHDWAGVARQVAKDLKEHFQDAEGGYVCAINAESEWQGKQQEGAYYLWQQEELATILTDEQRALWESAYTMVPWPEDTSKGHLLRRHHVSTRDKATPLDKWQEVALEEVSRILEKHRRQRPRPHADNKVLLGWNGLLLWALADAARLLSDHDIKEQAKNLFHYLYDHFSQIQPNRARIQGRGEGQAQLDDLAYLLNGLWAYLQLDFDPGGLAWAQQIRQRLLNDFLQDQGWLANPAAEDAPLKNTMAISDLSDDAILSPSVSAARACWLFGLWTDENDNAMERLQHWIDVNSQMAIPTLGGLWANFLKDMKRLRFVRVEGAPIDLVSWQQRLVHEYTPGEALFFMAKNDAPRGDVKATICEQSSCRMLTSVEELRDLLVRDGRWTLLNQP